MMTTNGDYEELLDEIVILLSAALSLAGVKDDKMDTALNIYQEEIEKVDDNAVYDYKSVCNMILNLKKTHKNLFCDSALDSSDCDSSALANDVSDSSATKGKDSAR